MKIIGWILFLLLSTCTLFVVTADGPTPEQQAEEKHKGFHCLSAWDGTHSDINKQIKATLRDPASFEHIKTEIAPNDNGTHDIYVTYRARNGFGGMNVERARGIVMHSSCIGSLIRASM